jgi:hypothetical protein
MSEEFDVRSKLERTKLFLVSTPAALPFSPRMIFDVVSPDRHAKALSREAERRKGIGRLQNAAEDSRGEVEKFL